MTETLDREQINRDAENANSDIENIGYSTRGNMLGYHCLALLAALKQAERERDEAREKLLDVLNRNNTTLAKAEARLAKVPALVAVLKGIASYERLPEWMRDKANEALADYEGE